MVNKVFTSILLVFIAIFLGGLYSLLSHLFIFNGAIAATIFGGVLSMFGGAFGAFGAYLVARHQIEQGKVQEKIKSLYSELPIYISLSIEFEKIVQQLESVVKSKNERFKDYEIDNDFFRNLIFTLDALILDRWVDTNKISDSILLKELLIFEESFRRTIKVLEYDIRFQEERIIELMFSNRYFEIAQLQNEIQIMLQGKYEYWKEIEYCLDKAKKLQRSILNRKSLIENIVEGKFDIANYQYFSTEDEFKVNKVG